MTVKPSLGRACLALVVMLPILASPRAASASAAGPREPRKVYLSFDIIALSNVDGVNETFEIDFYLLMRWYDPAFVKAPIGRLDSPPAWRPQLDFINGKNIQPKAENEVYDIVAPGIVQTINRYQGVLSAELDLRRFPFDSQVLPITLEDFRLTSDDLVFVYMKKNAIQSGLSLEETQEIGPLQEILTENFPGLQEWKIREARLHQSTKGYAFLDYSRFSRFEILFQLDRRPQYYLLKIMLVLLLLVVTPWLVFFLEPESLAERSAICITALLAVISHNYIISTALPRIAYLCVLDYFTFASETFVFLAAAESLLVFQLMKRGRKENGERASRLASHIDRISLCVFPPLLVGVCVFIYAQI